MPFPVRPPRPGPTERLGHAPRDIDETAQHAIAELDSPAMQKWVAKMAAKMHHGPSEPPISKTRKFLDDVKYLIALAGGIAALGWFGKAYVDGFQTREEADVVQEVNAVAHREMQTTLEAQNEDLEDLQLSNVRLELQQANVDDRLEALVEIQTADNSAERREARQHSLEIRARIAKRQRWMRDPRTLQRLVDEAQRGVEER